ncbi:hypothetical protein IPZ58_26810 [Streptomyces roseoverticillatus]|uniref:hypothetical protein n=1 Tax=Streptomyces roseoverticillatus TaxID=66429 RepID=UPI001F37372C|nr:hypothetical protein [Streptomyces roseoverticillatus]MCF3105175.1 hypothetical protein [Streptomyces roseoverticillatus]
MGSAVTFGELGRLCGEELPRRIALSGVLLPAASGSEQPVFPTLVKSDNGTTVAYACQYRQNAGNPPLLVALGLASSDPGYSTTCIPAAISSR